MAIWLLIVISGCGSGLCDKDYYVEVSGLEMLEDAEMVNCEDNLEWFTVAAFQLSDQQVRELLDSGDFKPVRSSLNMVELPIKWVNKIFAEVDQLSQHRFKYSGKVSCTLTLKEDSGQLVVFITDQP